MLKNLDKFGIALIVSLLASQTIASDVYIDQAGSTTNIDITQTGADNRLGSDTEASTIIGDNSDIDVKQVGSLNEADIETAVGASGTIIDYEATGSSNKLDVDISTASDTKLTTSITGDSNEVTLCGSLSSKAAAAASATCATELSANSVTTNLEITGDSNKIAVGANAASAVNNITIGENITSDSNIINLEQSGSDIPVVTLNVDGSDNAINITQN